MYAQVMLNTPCEHILWLFQMSKKIMFLLKEKGGRETNQRQEGNDKRNTAILTFISPAKFSIMAAKNDQKSTIVSSQNHSRIFCSDSECPFSLSIL